MARKPTETTERRPKTPPARGPVSGPGSAGTAPSLRGTRSRTGPKRDGALVCLLSVGPFDSVEEAETWADLAAHHMKRARVPAHIDLGIPPDPAALGAGTTVRVIVFAPGLTAALAGVRTLAVLRRAST